MSNPIDEPQQMMMMDHLKNRFQHLGLARADPFTLDFSSGPVASCSCPEKKLKKLYNYIDQESSRYAQSNIRSLYIYADLLGKAVHILGVNEFTL